MMGINVLKAISSKEIGFCLKFNLKCSYDSTIVENWENWEYVKTKKKEILMLCSLVITWWGELSVTACCFSLGNIRNIRSVWIKTLQHHLIVKPMSLWFKRSKPKMKLQFFGSASRRTRVRKEVINTYM